MSSLPADPTTGPIATAGGRGTAIGSRRSGLAAGFGAYLLWGVLPLYFALFVAVAPVEILAVRILSSLVVCVVLVVAVRGWRRLGALMRDRRVLGVMLIAALLISVNWLTFIVAATSGRIVESSLGYFLNPIVTVLLGVLVLGERLRPAQWVAVAVSAVAVVVLAIEAGAVSWIALVLAGSFGCYGLVKKRVSGRVDALSGIVLETAWLAPIAAVALVVLAATTGLTATESAGTAWLLAASGVATVAPLLLFAAGARRLPLAYLGFIQYAAPILQLGVGVLVLGEPMPLGRLLGFAIVWVAIGILVVDSAVAFGRARRRARR